MRGPANSPPAARSRVTVVQIGARRHYAVAAALAERGLLEGVLTDFYCEPGSVWWSLAAAAPGGGRLRGRWNPGLPRGRVRAPNLRTALGRAFRVPGSGNGDPVARWVRTGRRFGRWAAGLMGPGTGTVYAFTSAALEPFEEGRRRGLPTILDHATAPIDAEADLVDAAWERRPEWFERPRRSPHEAAYAERQRREWALADRILCGSALLRRMVERGGGPASRCTVVPLGVAPPEHPPSTDRPGEGLSVAFVGDDALRKGLPDALEACARAGVPPSRVVAAGAVALSPEGRRRASALATLPGRLGRRETGELLRRSHVLLLPTVNDTFGLVVLEAMARGCVPVVSDRAGAADVVEDGVSGFVVPAHDPDALAERLVRLASDPGLRRSMAEAAIRRAAEHTLARYGERLEAAIVGVESGGAR